jgi:hypothetical protein
MAVVVNSISASKAHIIIGVIALSQLLASLMLTESYTKIVPYLRNIYLDNRIVAYYLMLNTIVPFFFYLLLAIILSPDFQTLQNIVLMSLLLFNNNLLAHLLHVFSFSMKNTILGYLLIACIYLLVFLLPNILLLSLLTLLVLMLFTHKISSY